MEPFSLFRFDMSSEIVQDFLQDSKYEVRGNLVYPTNPGENYVTEDGNPVPLAKLEGDRIIAIDDWYHVAFPTFREEQDGLVDHLMKKAGGLLPGSLSSWPEHYRTPEHKARVEKARQDYAQTFHEKLGEMGRTI